MDEIASTALNTDLPAVNLNLRQSLRKQIFDFLSHQIANGKLVPGAYINVRQLTEELNVSRTPLREALAQLEVQGFVTIIPQRGVLINALSYEELINIFEILGALESHVLLTVFPRIRATMIDEMEACNRTMAEALEAEQNHRFHDANIRLHRIFLDLSDNEELKTYIGRLKSRIFSFALGSYRIPFKKAIIAEHVAFIKLLRAGDHKGAAAYLCDIHWRFNYPENFIRHGCI